MSPNIVKIMIHGLIALAPSADNNPNHTTALMLDARVPLECVGEHHPTLSFHVSDAPENNGKCRAAGCKLNNDECKCTDSLRNRRIWLELTPEPFAPMPPNAIADQPADDSQANNYGIPSEPNAPPAEDRLYIANMTKPPFNATLNPEYLAADPRVNDLFARMEIPSNDLTSCFLSKREDQGEAYVLPMSLKTINAPSKSADRSQAFAQMVLAKIKIKEGEPVKLHIGDFKGGEPTSFILAPGKHGYMINLSNAPDDLKRGDPCDDGIARHFAYFYEFAEVPPVWKERLIPHLRFVKGMKKEVAEVAECEDDPTLNPNDRPICPMASFIP